MLHWNDTLLLLLYILVYRLISIRYLGY